MGGECVLDILYVILKGIDRINENNFHQKSKKIVNTNTDLKCRGRLKVLKTAFCPRKTARLRIKANVDIFFFNRCYSHVCRAFR